MGRLSDNTWAAVAQQAAAERRQREEQAARAKLKPKAGGKRVARKKLPPPPKKPPTPNAKAAVGQQAQQQVDGGINNTQANTARAKHMQQSPTATTAVGATEQTTAQAYPTQPITAQQKRLQSHKTGNLAKTAAV